MNTLSLSPRYDLFRFVFPKTFLPKEVEEKYSELINQDKNVIISPIDYLNESIQQITIPGLNDLTIDQDQRGTRQLSTHKTSNHTEGEPFHKNITYSPANPLSQVTMEFTVTFRQNQGLYNYWLMYETAFHKVLKSHNKECLDDVFYVDILNEQGNPVSRIKLIDPRIDGIDGLTFSYNKTERSVETFDVKFKFNNIDFDFI